MLSFFFNIMWFFFITFLLFHSSWNDFFLKFDSLAIWFFLKQFFLNSFVAWNNFIYIFDSLAVLLFLRDSFFWLLLFHSSWKLFNLVLNVNIFSTFLALWFSLRWVFFFCISALVGQVAASLATFPYILNHLNPTWDEFFFCISTLAGKLQQAWLHFHTS